MIVSLYYKQIQEEGYLVYRTQIDNIQYAVKKENGCWNVVRIIDCKKDFIFSNEQYEAQKEEIASVLQKTGENNIHIMTLVFFENIKNAFEMVGEDYMCWLIDKVSMEMTLNNNRVEDFYGLRERLEAFLGKCKTFFENGDIKAIDDLSHSDYEKKKIKKIKEKKPIPITILMLSANITVFLTYLVIGEPFIDSYCMNPVSISAGEYYRLFTAMFLHAGVDHIFSNMILLFFMGEIIESKIGSVRYSILYVLSGVLGNVASYIYSLKVSPHTSIGASGAVFGLIGMFTIMAIIKYKGIEVPKKRLVLMLIFCIYSSFDAYVDFVAHFGGLATGLLLGVIMLLIGGKKSEG